MESFWSITFPDGTNNPNRIVYDISGQDISQSIPDEGLPILIDWYRYVDIGPRVVNVEKDTYRILFGLKGEFRNWNWETAVLVQKLIQMILLQIGYQIHLLKEH